MQRQFQRADGFTQAEKPGRFFRTVCTGEMGSRELYRGCQHKCISSFYACIFYNEHVSYTVPRILLAHITRKSMSDTVRSF